MRKYRSPIFAVLFVIVAAAFVFVCSYNIFFSLHLDVKNDSDLNVVWRNENGVEIDIENLSQLSAIVSENGYSLFHTVEEDYDDVYIAFKNSFADTDIFVNQNKVYSTNEHSYPMEKSLFSIDGASPQFHYTGIGDIVKGDVIRIDVKFICDSELYGIRNVILGSSGEIISTVFRSDLLGIVLCIALFCMGIILIMFYFAFRKAVSLHGVHYAGAFAVLASVYSISGSILLSSLEIVGADSLCIIRCLAYVTMFMPFILFFMENTKFRVSDRILQVASVIQAVVIAAIYILGISGAANIYRTRIIADISMLVQLLLILGVLIFDLNKNNEKRSTDFSFIAIYLIFLGMIAAQFVFGSGSSIPIIFVFSCLFFIISVLVMSMFSFSKAFELSNEAEKMGKIAFTDGLTGVGNIAAFKKKLNHLEVVKVNYKSIGIVQFDINNLKTINDTLGHEMGDKLITDGSAMINKCFGGVGSVYRTGGDEFVAVVCCENAFKLCNEAILKFEMAIDEYNSDDSHRFLLQIAYGAEFYNSEFSDQYLTLREVQKLADKKMYENKNELKEIAKREGLEVIRSEYKNNGIVK